MVRRINRIPAENCSISTPVGNIEYLLCRSLRRRSITLSVNDQGQVRLYLPRFVTPEDAHKFILEKSRWVMAKVAQARGEQQFLSRRGYAAGQTFLFLGNSFPLQITLGVKKRGLVRFDGQAWHINLPASIAPEGKDEGVKKLLTDWYREQAQEVFPGRIFNYGRIMGLDPQTIAVKTQRRSWGSCSYRRRAINLNWQLVMAPLAVIDYVVVHELAHLVHPNHSVRFWKKVEKFMPDYKSRKKWLQENRLRMVLP